MIQEFSEKGEDRSLHDLCRGSATQCRCAYIMTSSLLYTAAHAITLLPCTATRELFVLICRAARLQSGQSGGGGFLGEEPLETFPEKRSAVDGDVRVPLSVSSDTKYEQGDQGAAATPCVLVCRSVRSAYVP